VSPALCSLFIYLLNICLVKGFYHKPFINYIVQVINKLTWSGLLLMFWFLGSLVHFVIFPLVIMTTFDVKYYVASSLFVSIFKPAF